jgi:hypothetical protein
MLKSYLAAPLMAVAVVLVTPGPARAQIASPPWGEPINTPDRFVVLASYNNEAVYDQETGLVWEQSPATTPQIWSTAQYVCNRKTVGNRKGWRVPTVQELASLIDPSVSLPGPALPAGHPFDQTALRVFYWSASTRGGADLAGDGWTVAFNSGEVFPYSKASNVNVWCVRGGQAGWNP